MLDATEAVDELRNRQCENSWLEGARRLITYGRDTSPSAESASLSSRSVSTFSIN